MRTWLVTYVDKNFKQGATAVVAPTYTMALVQFMVDNPDCTYTGVLEVLGNEITS